MIRAAGPALVLALFCLRMPAMRSFQALSVTTRPLGASIVACDILQLPRKSGYQDQRTTSLHLLLADTAVSDPTVLQSFVRNTDFWIFLAGIFPFAWATVEFWRRIAFGEPFGTGSDSVVIGMDDSPSDSRGRRVLGKGALITAYVLFALAFTTIGIVLYAVVTSDIPPDVLSPAVSSTTLPG